MEVKQAVVYLATACVEPNDQLPIGFLPLLQCFSSAISLLPFQCCTVDLLCRNKLDKKCGKMTIFYFTESEALTISLQNQNRGH